LKEYLIAIDIGTTSAKSFSISTKGEILFSHQAFYPTDFSKQGFAEQNPELIFNSVVDLITDSVIPSARCLGICFSAAMHSLTAVDDRGKGILPLLIWSDTRSRDQTQKIIDEGLAQRFCNITGTPVHPMSPLPKLLWLKEHRSEIFIAAHKFLSIKEYVLFRLTDNFVVDYSTASATGLFGLDQLKWSSEVLSYVGLDKEKLSMPVPVDHSTLISESYTGKWGIDPKTPIIVGASDGCLAQYGSDALGPDDITITVGTSGAVRIASPTRKVDPQGKIFNYILNDKTFVCGGATNCGSALLTWFKNSMDKNAADDINEFVKQASKTPAGSDGLLCIPFLLGERAPVYNSNAAGIFWGVKIHHTSLHFQRALLEGICFEIKWILETIEKVFGGKNNLTLSGGITRSPVWVQLLCDVLGRTIITHSGIDASAAGAARLGFDALKVPFEAPKTSTSSYSPKSDFHDLYEKHFSVFKQIYERLESITL
jgi:gluconokinase